VKSFRAAAERIVRQESSSPTDVLRLLGSAVLPARAIAGERDEWDMRLGALAALGEYDALAVLSSKPAALVRSHNVSDPRALRSAFVEVVDDVTRRGAAAQVRGQTALADGRESGEAMVAPLTAVQGVEGVLVALASAGGSPRPTRSPHPASEPSWPWR